MTFHADLSFGKKYEKKAMEMLGGGEQVEGKFSGWDIKHNNTKYEVKADRRAASTGNLCIEYEHTGIPSGLSLTEADEWIFYVVRSDNDYDCYRVPVKHLHQKVVGARKWHTDGGNSRFYLVPLSNFTSYLV